MKKYIGEGLKSSGPNLNVLNVLRALLESDSRIYIPSDYESENAVVSFDPRVIGLPKVDDRPLIATGITSNSERFNFSISCLRSVLVAYPDISAEIVEMREKKVFRNYTIIKDGVLKNTQIYAEIPEDLFDIMVAAGILYYNERRLVEINHKYIPNFPYLIDFSNIPVVSLNWAQPDNIGLYDYMVEELKLSQMLKVIRALRKEFPVSVEISEEESDIYSDVIHTTAKNTSEYPYITYSFPELAKEDLINREAYRESIQNLSYTELTTLYRVYNKKLEAVRFMKRCIIFAIESSSKKGSYEWTDLVEVPRSKDKFSQTTTVLVSINEGCDASKIKMERRCNSKYLEMENK